MQPAFNLMRKFLVLPPFTRGAREGNELLNRQKLGVLGGSFFNETFPLPKHPPDYGSDPVPRNRADQQP